MSTKKVTLDKTEYDFMEQELNDLRQIVAERHVVTIVEENMNWRLTYATSSGTRIRYIVHEEQAAVKALAEQLDHVQKQLENTKAELHLAQMECGRKADEIRRLERLKWYQRLWTK